jgi:hypothetical protein
MQIYLVTHDFEKRRERTFFVGVCMHMLLHNNNVSKSFDEVYKSKQMFRFSLLASTESSKHRRVRTMNDIHQRKVFLRGYRISTK